MQKHYIRTQQANKQTINQKTELLTARRRCLDPQLVSVRPCTSNREPGATNEYMNIQHLWYSIIAGSQWVLFKN